MGQMSEIKRLANAAGVPEIIEYTVGCRDGALNYIKHSLMTLVATDAYPSAAYRSRYRSSIMDGIWEAIWEYDPHDYLKGMILSRIVFTADRYYDDKEALREELRVLTSLWDASCTKPDVDEECEAVEEWDYLYLRENYDRAEPSVVSLEHVAVCTLNYIRTRQMTGGVSGREALAYFGWDRL